MKKQPEEVIPEKKSKIPYVIVGIIIVIFIIIIAINGAGVGYTDNYKSYTITEAENLIEQYTADNLNYFRQYWNPDYNAKYNGWADLVKKNTWNSRVSSNPILNKLTIDTELSKQAKARSEELSKTDSYTTNNPNEIVYRLNHEKRYTDKIRILINNAVRMASYDSNGNTVSATSTPTTMPIYSAIINNPEKLFNKNWTKMGIGVTFKDGRFYYSILFS